MANIAKFGAKVLLVSALASSAALAEGAFVGLEGGFNQSKASLDSELSDTFSDPKDGAFEFGLKAGQDFGSFRVWGGYSYRTKASEDYSFAGPGGNIDVEMSWKSHNFLVGADYTPSITESFKAVLGAYTGLAITKAEIKGNGKVLGYDFSENGSETSAGAVVGIRLGGIYEIDKSNEIEFGVKSDYTKTGIDGVDKATSYGAYVGYNYKF